MAFPQKNHYEILHLKGPEVTSADIEKAYRTLSIQHHPDKNPGDPQAVQRFKEVKDAYDVLSDIKKRAAYDAQLRKNETALGVEFFIEHRDLALASLGKFLGSGHVAYARVDTVFDGGRKVLVRLHIPKKSAVADRDWQEALNALESLRAAAIPKPMPEPEKDLTPVKANRESEKKYQERLKKYQKKREDARIAALNKDDEDLSFYINGEVRYWHEQTTRVELVKFFDDHWNHLFFKSATVDNPALPGVAHAAASGKSRADEVTPVPYFLTQNCIMAGLRNILTERKRDEVFRKYLTDSLKNALQWRLIGPKESDIKYPCLDFSQFPTIKGFEQAGPELLRRYYKTAVGSYIYKSKIFSPIDPETGEFEQKSAVHAMTDSMGLEYMREAGIIPDEIARGVKYPPYVSKAQSRSRRRGSEEGGEHQR